MKKKKQDREDTYKEETDDKIKTLESKLTKLQDEISELHKYRYDNLESNAKMDYEIMDNHQSICVIEIVEIIISVAMIIAYAMLLSSI